MMIEVTSPWPTNKFKKTLLFISLIPYGILCTLFLGIMLLIEKHSLVTIKLGAIEMVCTGRIAKKLNDNNWGAFTFGWCIYYWGEDQYSARQRIHERVHVRQMIQYNILQIILYAYYGLRYGYERNPFEIEAYKEDGRLL